MIENKRKVVIFDLDGTLLDTLADLGDSVNRMLLHFGYQTHSYEEIKNMVGNGAARLALNAIPGHDDDPKAEECVKYLLSNYDDGANKKTKPYRGVPELLDVLRAHGIKTAVVTNKLDHVARSLCEGFFGNKIDFVLGDRKDIRKKPCPDGVLLVMSELGCDRGVYVGDADTDIAVAKNAGMPSVSVTWGFRDRDFLSRHGAERYADDAQTLLSLVGELLDEELGELELSGEEK